MAADTPENTYRALKDQGLLPKLRCRWGFHRWTIYNKIGVNARTTDWNSALKCNTIAIIYKSVCADCGIKKFKTEMEPTVEHGG